MQKTAQAAEKYLKALAERCLVDDPEAVTLLKTHNLRSLVNKLKEQIPGIPLDSRDCKWLGDFYFDARYPGDNFVTVSEEDALECLRITEHIRETVKEEIEAFESLLKEDALEGFKRL